MLKTVEDVSSTKKRLRIEIPPEAIEKEIKDALSRLRSRVRLPGFRQGKVPMPLLEKRFGRDAETEAMEKVIPAFYQDALKEAKIRPVANPVFEEAGDFKRHNPLSMTLLVEVKPEIKDLKYEGIKVREIPVSVEEKDVEGTLQRLQEQKTVYEPSEEPVKKGDVVTLDYELKGEGRSFTDQLFKVGSASMPVEFSERLVGMRKAEEAEFGVTFPEDFHLREMAGKETGFRVALKDVKKGSLPPMDDELAKDLGFETLEALKGHIREQIMKSKEETVRNIMRAEVIKKLVEAHEFDAPESLLEGELVRLVDEARVKGRKEPEEALKEEFRPAALRHTKAALILQAIGEKEGISVTEEDVREKVQWLASRMSLTPENVMKYYVTRDGSLDGLRDSIFEEKAMDLILGKAEVEKGDR